MTAQALPKTQAEWDHYLGGFASDPEKYKAAKEDGSFDLARESYITAKDTAERKGLNEQISEHVQAAMVDMAKRNGAAQRVNQAPVNRVHLNESAPGAGLNGRYGSSVEFFQNALGRESAMGPEQRAKKVELQNYSSQTGEGGGYLIPEEWRSEIFAGPEMSQLVVRPRATVIPMGSKSLHFPAVDFTTEVGEVLGGIIMYWMDEGGTIPDTSAAFAQIELQANRLAGAAVVPNDTLKDAGALEAWLRTQLPRAIREFEDRAFLKGDGVKKPLGALTNHPAMIVQGDRSGQSTASIAWENVIDMYARLLPESYSRAVWVVTPDALPELYTMALSVGTGGSAVMIGENAGPGNAPQSMLGIPLVVSRKAPAAMGTQGDISLVDFSYYAIGDRQDVRVDASEHAQFLADNTVFKVIERVDGQPLLLSALTPENNGPTLSAFVQLETRTTD